MSRALIETHRPIVFSCEWAHELNVSYFFRVDAFFNESPILLNLPSEGRRKG